jgi:predicted site-specific integrase-resolvase
MREVFKPFMPLNAVAETLDVTPTTLRRWIDEGNGPRVVKVGCRFKVRPDDLESYVRRRMIEPAE